MTDLAKEFDNHFWSARGYLAVPTNKKGSNDKVKFDYRAIPGDINKKHWEDHFKTENGLTPSPIIKNNMCYWGAVDDDRYDLEQKEIIKLVEKAKELNLVPSRSKSGGLQFYAFASVEVPTRLMRGRLIKARNILNLPKETELFPKQLEVTEDKPMGNGITIPYRGYNKDPTKIKTYGLKCLYGESLYQLNPEQFVAQHS